MAEAPAGLCVFLSQESPSPSDIKAILEAWGKGRLCIFGKKLKMLTERERENHGNHRILMNIDESEMFPGKNPEMDFQLKLDACSLSSDIVRKPLLSPTFNTQLGASESIYSWEYHVTVGRMVQHLPRTGCQCFRIALREICRTLFPLALPLLNWSMHCMHPPKRKECPKPSVFQININKLVAHASFELKNPLVSYSDPSIRNDRGQQAGGISYEDDMLTTLCEKMEGKQAFGRAGCPPVVKPKLVYRLK